MTDPNKNTQDSNNVEFVDEVSQYISTDNITDLKSGIFNLFNNLYQSYSFQYGPIDGMTMSIEYLKSIIDFFQSTLEENTNNNNQ